VATDRYNGPAEAGIGRFKTRFFYQAIAHGARTWTSDDAEAARQQANQTPCSWGDGTPAAPQQRWARRATITVRQPVGVTHAKRGDCEVIAGNHVWQAISP
jgi:hypothetical protein